MWSAWSATLKFCAHTNSSALDVHFLSPRCAAGALVALIGASRLLNDSQGAILKVLRYWRDPERRPVLGPASKARN